MSESTLSQLRFQGDISPRNKSFFAMEMTEETETEMRLSGRDKGQDTHASLAVIMYARARAHVTYTPKGTGIPTRDTKIL